MHTCKCCGKEIPAKRLYYNSEYCSNYCRSRSKYLTFRTINPKSSLPTATVGAVSELVVCCELLKMGYEVFRAVSPACSCDIAILKNKILTRVEVRSGCILPSGKITFATSSNERYDIMAIVTKEGIVYHNKHRKVINL